MRIDRTSLAYLGAVAGLAIPAGTATAAPEKYGPSPAQTATVTHPVGAPRGAVVLIHGGGWRNGRAWIYSDDPAAPAGARGLAKRLAAHGFVSIVIEYTDADLPAQVRDVRLAFSWVREHANRWGVDPHRVAAWGDSAGGHLALLAGLDGVADAVVANAAPTDLRSMRAVFAPGYLDGIVGCAPAACPARWRKLSPARRWQTMAVPVMVTWITGDPVVAARTQARFGARMVLGTEHALVPSAFAAEAAFLKRSW